MSGEVYAIACAFFWALSTTLLKSQTERMGVLSLSAWRMVPGLCIYLSVLAVSGRMDTLLRIPPRAVGFLIGGALAGMGLAVFLAERFTWIVLAGALLITAGVYLLAFPRGTVQVSSSADRAVDLRGVGLALAAAAAWSISTVSSRVALNDVDPVIANVVRLSTLVIALFSLLYVRNEITQFRAHGLRPWGITLLAGVLSTGVSSYAFMMALQRAGAAKTSILSSITPLFGVPLSLVLGEKLTGRMIMGTILTMAGVWLIL